MEKAKEILSSTNKKISVVAEEVGIPNTSYFCMVFKNAYGMAPKEYQEMIIRN
jgi:two-component system response regulator YesN